MVYIHVIKTKLQGHYRTGRTLTLTHQSKGTMYSQSQYHLHVVSLCVCFSDCVCVCKSSYKCQLGRVKGHPCLCTIILHMQPPRNVICHCRNNLLTRSCHVSDFLTFPINTTLQTTCTHIITIFMLWYILHCYLFINIPSGSEKTTRHYSPVIVLSE